MTPLRAALVPLLLMGACAADPETAGQTLQSGSPEVLVQRLPAESGGLRRGTVSVLDGGGREVSYANPRRTAAAVVELIPARAAAGAHAKVVALAADGGGPHRRLREVASFRDGALQCSDLEGAYGRHQPVRSLVCTGEAGPETQVRLRVSMPRRDPPPADARAFARGIAAALR